MKKCNLLILFTLFVLGTSCSMMDRRDFTEEMGEYEFGEPVFEANRDFMVVAGDTGRDYRTSSEILERTPATARDAEEYSYRSSLKREKAFLENKLDEAEYQKYLGIKAKLGDVSHQIYYLRLSSLERDEYLDSRGIDHQYIRTKNMREVANSFNQSGSAYLGRSIASARDVSLGMGQNDVLQNWGQPDHREVAGDPRYGNERWSYRRNGEVKYIYFENGRVQGWNGL